jgi:hypothetical protein
VSKNKNSIYEYIYAYVLYSFKSMMWSSNRRLPGHQSSDRRAPLAAVHLESSFRRQLCLARCLSLGRVFFKEVWGKVGYEQVLDLPDYCMAW